MSAGMKYWAKLAAGSFAAVVVGKALARWMDDEHDYEVGKVKGSYPERKKRFLADGSTANWFDAHYFINKDGLAVFWRRWVPTPIAQPTVKGIIIISHGLGEHSGRYEVIARKLTSEGFAVYACDHQGHGQSEGTRQHVRRFNDFVADVHQLTELAKTKHPLVEKVFLLGHSMGSLIAIHAINEAPRLYDGVVLSAPPLKINAPPGAAQALPVVGSLFPKMPSMPLELDTLCRDHTVVDRYHNDPLNNMGPNTMRLIAELVGAMEKVSFFASDFNIPYLLMHGSADAMCLHSGSADFHDSTTATDKDFVTYQDAFHELFNEPNNEEESIKEAVQWFKQRI